MCSKNYASKLPKWSTIWNGGGNILFEMVETDYSSSLSTLRFYPKVAKLFTGCMNFDVFHGHILNESQWGASPYDSLCWEKYGVLNSASEYVHYLDSFLEIRNN